MKTRKNKLKKYEGLIFLAPWIIGVLIFTVYPFVSSFILSFTNYNLIDKPHFIGLTNYINLFTKDRDFLNSLIVTLKYTFITVPTQLMFALFIAFILNFKIKGINMYRTAYYIPSILGGNVAIAVLWRFLWGGNGLINQVIQFFGGSPLGWLSDPNLSMFVIAILKIWQFGSSMVIFLAALKEIPAELYEAAQIDGAKKWSIFFRITVPLITPTIFFNLVMQLVNAFQEFNAPFLVTGGGPAKATMVTSLLIYNNSFKFFKMGYASAMSWVLFLIIMVFAIIIFKTQNKWVYYSDGGND